MLHRGMPALGECDERGVEALSEAPVGCRSATNTPHTVHPRTCHRRRWRQRARPGRRAAVGGGGVGAGRPTVCCTNSNHLRSRLTPQELSIGQIKFKAFDLGGHEIARKVWKDYYAKVRTWSECRAKLSIGRLHDAQLVAATPAFKRAPPRFLNVRPHTHALHRLTQSSSSLTLWTRSALQSRRRS